MGQSQDLETSTSTRDPKQYKSKAGFRASLTQGGTKLTLISSSLSHSLSETTDYGIYGYASAIVTAVDHYWQGTFDLHC